MKMIRGTDDIMSSVGSGRTALPRDAWRIPPASSLILLLTMLTKTRSMMKEIVVRMAARMAASMVAKNQGPEWAAISPALEARHFLTKSEETKAMNVRIQSRKGEDAQRERVTLRKGEMTYRLHGGLGRQRGLPR